MKILQSLFYFVLAGICEIGGGYLVWQWLRAEAGWLCGCLGFLVLGLYGVIPTLQPSDIPFGRVYAAYGGVFILLALLWGWWVDRVVPDRADWIGAAIALVGVGGIFTG